jgi:glycosyltransferase involved in cell wall biosynthesis
MNDLVSIILPVYNADGFLRQAIESIINQTYSNLEIIIINDGSTDESHKIISEYLSDERVIYINRENRGLVHSLNEGISISRGTFIARMDADDVSHPDRIYQQILFFEKNKDYALVGTRVVLIDEKDNKLGACFRPTNYKRLLTYALYGSPFAHPTVMFNTKVIDKNRIIYNRDQYPIEDLDLWLRIIKEYKCGNLKERLLSYRICSTSISSMNGELQKNMANKLRINSFNNMECLINSPYVFNERSYLKFMLGFFCSLSKNQLSRVEVFLIYLRIIRKSFIGNIR